MRLYSFITNKISVDGRFLRTYIPFLYHLYLKVMYINKEDKDLSGIRKSFGEKHPDKTFFVIGMDNYGLGLLSYFNCVLGYIKFARRKGYIPIVDMKNYPNTYLEKDEVGIINSWEYYFDQPCNYTLDEVYESKNVMMSSGICTIEAGPPILWFYYCRWWSRKRAQEYDRIIGNQLKVNRKTKAVLDDNYSRILSGKRAIGVVKRGTDIINCSGHAIQPQLSELIDRTKKMLTVWNCDYVFLATEETSTVKTFREVFGDRLLINQSARVDHYSGGAIGDVSFNRANDKYLKGLEYLTTVYLLSQCTCLIGSLVGSTTGALLLNKDRYEHTYIYDLGVYHEQ